MENEKLCDPTPKISFVKGQLEYYCANTFLCRKGLRSISGLGAMRNFMEGTGGGSWRPHPGKIELPDEIDWVSKSLT